MTKYITIKLTEKEANELDLMLESYLMEIEAEPKSSQALYKNIRKKLTKDDRPKRT